MAFKDICIFRTIKEIVAYETAILQQIKELRIDMGTVSVGFADVQAAVNQMVNDSTTQNNAIAAQIKEVQQMILDFTTKPGGDGPSQADLQGVIAQLQAVHSLVLQNTAAVQASGTAIAQTDPNAAPPSEPPPAPEPSPEPSPAPVEPVV